MIEVKHVTLIQNNTCLLYDVSCELLPGHITAFIGESGSGKTSLLKCISQLYPNYSGFITYNGVLLSSYTPQERIAIIGLVSQQINLFPHMTALENCMHPLINVLGFDHESAKIKALHTLASLGIAELANNYPTVLSGGQQQKIAIARALVLNPRVLLFDEATATLDPRSEDKLHRVFKELSVAGIAIAISSHDMDFVRNVSDRIYFMEHGRIVEQCDAKDKLLPTTHFIAPFINSSDGLYANSTNSFFAKTI